MRSGRPLDRFVSGWKHQKNQEERRSAMSNVVLINAFEVPAGKDEEFLQGW